MFLDVFVESVYGRQRQAGKDCLRNYRKHAAELQRHAGRRLRLSDLSQPLVARWLLGELERGLSPYTVTGKRSSVLAVWSLARDMGYVTSIPRAPTIRRPDLTVRVWTAADVLELSESARSIPGTIVGGLPRGASWQRPWALRNLPSIGAIQRSEHRLSEGRESVGRIVASSDQASI